MAWTQFDLRSDSHSPGCRECHSLTAVSVRRSASSESHKLFLFGGNDQNVRMNEVHAFDTVQMKWSKCKPSGNPPIPRSAHSTTLVSDTVLYTFGGWDGNEELGDLHAFDTATETWTRVITRGDKPAPRHFHNACKLHGHLYLFGGYDGTAWRNDVVSLDLESNTWRNVNIVGDRPGVRASAACCVFGDDKVLVFGGYDGREFLDDLWILHTDPDVDAPHRWQKIKPPARRRERHADSWPLARSGHSLEVVDSLVIFFGGRYRNGRFNDVYVLNTDTMQWWQPTIAGHRPQPRKTHATARIGNRIFVVGGHDGGNWLDDMHLLDIAYIRDQCKPCLSVHVPKSTFLENMAGMLDQDSDQSMADVVFVVQGRKVKLHRAILAARSEYFHRMLTNGMYETKADEIALADVSYNVFLALVRFLYTDQLPPGDSLVLPLLHQAQKFGLPRLSLLCQRSLEAQLDATNVAALLDAADTHRALPLREACITFILRSFDMVSCTRGFLQLRNDLLREVLVRRAERMPNRAVWGGDSVSDAKVLTAGGSGSPAAGGGTVGGADDRDEAHSPVATTNEAGESSSAVPDATDLPPRSAAGPVRGARARAGAGAGAGAGAATGAPSSVSAASALSAAAARHLQEPLRRTHGWDPVPLPAHLQSHSRSRRQRPPKRAALGSGSHSRRHKRSRTAREQLHDDDSEDADDQTPSEEDEEA